jgi:hypothetical protein
MHSQFWKLPQIIWQAHTRWLLILILLINTACTSIGYNPPTPTQIDRLTIDPVFREFYRHLGGEDVLGPPISPVFNNGTARIQYVQKAKMVFDPSTSIRQRFTLAPLGVEMGVIEPPVLPPEHPGFNYDGGHVIAPEFLPLYEKLGAYVVGKPLTEVRYNSIRRRHEQYFESVGFYRHEGSEQVHLLDYGVWACNDNCRQHISALRSPDATIDLITRIDPAFVPFVNQWGADFTGFAISEPYVNKEGNWEQVFENVVLEADSPDAPDTARLRPLTQRLNISPDTPREFTQRSDQHFIPREGKRGYELQSSFWEYLGDHGGLELSGAPITHLAPLNGSVLHQCFENLCLMYDQQAPPSGRVRPEPVGHVYKTLYYQPTHAANRLQSEPMIRIWERYPFIIPGQEQEVAVSVIQDNLPLSGMQPTLVLTMLDGSEKALAMEVTDASGRSSQRLAPIEGPTGSLILYKICLPLPEEQESCKEDSFVLWYPP